MTPAARLAATVSLIDLWQEAGRPLDALLSAHFRSNRYIGSKDRQAIAETVYAVFRHMGRLTFIAREIGATEESVGATPEGRPAIEPDGRLLTLLWATLFADPAPDLAGLLAADDRYGLPPSDEAETALLARAIAWRDGGGISALPPAVAGEVPAWAAAGLGDRFGETAPRQFEALLREAPVDLRVNTRKMDRTAALAKLAKRGIDATPTPLSPIGLRLTKRVPLAGEAIFTDGVVEPQDEGSQIAALLVDARPGEQIVDFCAGAGGKSLALAAKMEGRGRIVACDVSEGRLRRARTRLARAGVDNIEPKLLTGSRDKWVKRQKGKFDRVLIDAPCSGTGAWRRNPDSRWKAMELEPLLAEQAEILDSACRLVKPGGRLIYVTCSLLPAENEGQIDLFRAAHPDFVPVPVADLWPALGSDRPCPTDGEWLILTPADHGTDGFFVAVLEKRVEGAHTSPTASEA